jgi:hypothetical protein
MICLYIFRLVRRASDFRLPSQNLPGVNSTHAQDRCQVWQRITAGITTHDFETIDGGRCPGRR